MITKKVWFGAVAAVGGGACIAVAALNGFVPGLEDVADPLGRPSELSLEVIHSASEFDRISAGLVPAHLDLGRRAQVLRTLSGDLDGLVGKAGELVPAAGKTNEGTAAVRDIARPLPLLIDRVTGRAREATPEVTNLGAAVGSVTNELENIHDGLGTVQGNLASLGPRAEIIMNVLEDVQEESSRLRPIGPLLPLIRPLNEAGVGPALSGVHGLLNVGE